MNRNETTALIALLIAAATALALSYTLTSSISDNTNKIKTILEIIQTSITIIAILITGTFAAFKFQVFRELAPHLSISHEISHRPIGDSYIHIGVTVTLHNKSKVAMKIRQGEYLLQQIKPITDAEIESLDAPSPNAQNDHIEWPILDEQKRIWDGKGLTIDPGEYHQAVFESIIPLNIETVLVYSYFNNPNYYPNSKLSEGWSATSFYDLTQATDSSRN